MNKFHKELLEELRKHSGKGTSHTANDSYLSSGHIYYSVAVPEKREVVKKWAKSHADITLSEYENLLNSLYMGESYEEKTMASLLLEYLPKLRKQLDPLLLDKWLDVLTGWAEIDSLSQSNFTAAEMLGDWNTWKALLIQFSKDKNISKRRASLVLLTGPVAHSQDEALATCAFAIIERLQGEKDILITKAISWLLRSMIRYHRGAVEEYLALNEKLLPKIAVRETKNRLLTGKKSRLMDR